MKITRIKVFVIVIIILILGVVLTAAFQSASQTLDTAGKYDAFATCLKNSGATFYGASWCPHCQAQKKLFGSAESLLPYVECSTPDGKQAQLCADKKIMGYPTWELKDGTRIPDENEAGVSLETLAQKTGCTLPQ